MPFIYSIQYTIYMLNNSLSKKLQSITIVPLTEKSFKTVKIERMKKGKGVWRKTTLDT